jgi:hypothetical protein
MTYAGWGFTGFIFVFPLSFEGYANASLLNPAALTG